MLCRLHFLAGEALKFSHFFIQTSLRLLLLAFAAAPTTFELAPRACVHGPTPIEPCKHRETLPVTSTRTLNTSAGPYRFAAWKFSVYLLDLTAPIDTAPLS